MVNPVSLSRVQESVTVQTLECCSCLNAELKHKLGKGSRERGLGGMEEEKGGHREGAGEKHKGFHNAAGSGASLFQTSKKQNKNKKPKHHVKLKAIM